jgi:hypothetical protein
MKILSFFTLLFLFASCHCEIRTNSDRESISTDLINSTGMIVSGYQVDKDYFLEQCLLDYDTMFCNGPATEAVVENINDQLEAAFAIKGTAFAVQRHEGETILLTAGHTCESMNSTNKNIEAFFQAFTFPRSENKPLRPQKYRYVYDINRQKYPINNVIYTNSDNPDICMVSVKGMFPHNVAIAERPPQLGQRITNIAAPFGIFNKQTIIIFDGYFSGHMNDNDIYSIPAAPGSSGSPVFHNNKLIGLIHATDRRFNHISYGTPLTAIQNLLTFE